MAQHQTLTIDATWTEITNADVSSITFQNTSARPVAIMVTAGATAPTDFEGSLVYGPGQGEVNAALSDLAPGVTGGNRVYAIGFDGVAQLAVSHA